jgi:hypothetical protein
VPGATVRFAEKIFNRNIKITKGTIMRSDILTITLSLLLLSSIQGQEEPAPVINAAGIISASNRAVLFDQMDNAGTNSITSQNFEPANDIFDSFAADDFAFMDDTWSIGSIEVAGVYYNDPGPASSVNVWIYSSDGFGGLPQNIIYAGLNIVPSAGLADGSFTIDLPVPVILTEGWYWLCVQANMDSSSGQWGWTGRTVQSFSGSAWMNPGGGFGTPCTPSWGYRVTNCGVGTEPDNCFRINGDIIPVELISFTAEVIGNDVSLNWATSTETNNKGFEIQRSEVGDQKSEWETVGFVEGKGTTTEEQNYSFTDKKVPEGSYTYRLKQIDLNGTVNYSEEVNIEVKSVYTYYLDQNYPNPFNPATTIKFGLKKKSNVRIDVFNSIGENVKTILNEERDPGNYTINFNAVDMPSGVYLYRITAETFSSVKKMMLVK